MATAATQIPGQALHDISLPIEGMTCASCVGRVEKALRGVRGVQRAEVNLATERASVSVADDVDVADLVSAIGAAGYIVPVPAPIELSIEGMTCASCVGRVERSLADVPGVQSATVNLATERAFVTACAGVSAETLIDAVEKAGYGAARVSAAVDSGNAAKRDAEAAVLQRNLMIAAALTLPVFVIEMGSHLFPPLHHLVMRTIGMQASWTLQFVLASLVLLFPGRAFLAKGVPALLRRAPDMNSLVALGTMAAWGYSTVATFAPHWLPPGTVNVFFEAAAVIVTLILLGRWLEAKAKGRTSRVIEQLVALAPQTARVRRGTAIVELPVAEIQSGDVVELRPGERVAVDGVVVEGESFVDESMISGEPVPVAKSEGAEVVGGTINGQGNLAVRATTVGEASVLARIIRMVEQAQGAKLPIQALVDRVTMWFVPAVIALASLTFIIWLLFGPDPALGFALVNAVAVLIIACPCAMGLATPTSIMVGTGRAAEMGVLFRKGEALQALREAKIVALDKTGTLTEGRPTLTDFIVLDASPRDELLAMVAAIEAKSEHPIARAILEAAEAEGLTLPAVSRFEARPGFGVEAEVAGRRVAIGADRYLNQLGVDVASFEDLSADLGHDGKSPLYVAVNGRLAAMVAVADPLKPEAVRAVAALRKLGLKVAMITGDNVRTARTIARQAGIDHVVAEVMPDGKVSALEALRNDFGKAVFVGDGINDAPALAAADVGIAIGSGTDIAIEAADVVLMAGDLGNVPKAIALSSAVMANIRQNLFWAFGYNTALIPVAAGLLYPASGTLLSPMLAAGAMGLSSVFVLTNALRLKRFVPSAI
ncbi:heavy metal translocating P-type ATPase [Sphingopyxis sp. XHP0097]|uniref:Heavy metal translocating P-type ATPase n=1 Tax=Sphingopyxis jiangsuensis TaxID=2871171 RepID=A0ABS7MBX0_9SPHN|nr:heavy metal translocating P-type ATPase [Sphingopyxis jiangsuensis]MBY4636169.1 heavy metal translocating P-type ATPase [Sphingopyxis jiangsuensis]